MKLCRNKLHDVDVVGVCTAKKICRACKNRRNERYQATPRGRVQKIAMERRYYLRNREKFIAKVSAYDNAHVEQMKKRKRKYKESVRGVNFWIKVAKENA